MRELAVAEISRKVAVRPIAQGSEIPPVPLALVRAWETFWESTVRRAQQIEETGFASFEKEFREDLLKLGAGMLDAALPCAVGTGYEHSRRECTICGGKAEFHGCRPKTITTLVREIRLRRAYYRCPTCGVTQFPLDEVLSVKGTGFSPGVREAISFLNAKVPFDEGVETLERLSCIRMAGEEGRKLAEELGKRLELETLEEIDNVWQVNKPTPREIGETAERMYFSPDGTHVNTQEAGWTEAKVGTVFTTNIPGRGQEPEREHTRYAATMGKADDLGRRLYTEGLKLGFEAGKTEPVVVGDGAHWIWNWADGCLPKERVEIIDFYHASEKLWEVSRTVFGEENPDGKTWAKKYRDWLFVGRFDDCMRALRRLKPRTKEGREKVRATIHYYETNRERMRYAEFRRRGYFIGSGVTESSCKRLVGARLKQAGMRWVTDGAQAILQLRTAWLNKRWDCLWLN